MGHFLITWHESGDEIHFMVLPMSEYEYVDSLIGKLSDTKTSWGDVCKYIEEIDKKSIDTFFIQTYCSEDWSLGKYDIKKIISLPEFGC